MALPDFKKLQQDKTAIPDWAKYMKDGEFISYNNSYKVRTFLDLFDDYIYPCEETGDLRYYLYDPVKHGADPTKKYPLTVWFHGASNSLMGKDCIMCCGAEQYASPKYQERMGGAYILVPLCNETRDENGNIHGAWNKVHSAPVKDIIDKVYADNIANIGKKIILGASSGGYFTWQMLEDYIGFFNGAVPIASGYFPQYDALDRIADGGTKLLIAHGRHDEMAVFEECIQPHIEKLSQLQNCICFFPEWVYNGDGGISSVFYGFEMGQHCMINWIQHDLMFDDGTPADRSLLPDGITGWIRDI